MLNTSKIEYVYSQGPRLSFPDLKCGQGETVLVLGKSGCGKSTWLHLMAGLMEIQVGKIEIAGQDFGKMDSRAKDRFRGKHIGIVFQRPYFIDSLNLEENLLLASYLSGLRMGKGRVKSLSERLNIGHLLKKKPSHLSIGEQQRANIARAVINSPKLILADEPTSALDDQNCQEVLALLKEQAETEKSVLIIVTHDQRLKSVIERSIIL